MQLVVLGSGTAIPRPGRAPSGLLVEEGGRHLLLDGGAGTLMRLAEAGVPLEVLDAVLYTHLHIDHTGALVPLLFALKNPDFVRARPLPLFGPPGLADLHARLATAYGAWIEAPPCGLELHEWSAGPAPEVLPGWQVVASPVRHGASAHGLRLTSPAGRVLCYSGDTDECDAIVELGRGVDLLVLECSHPDARKADGHLSPTGCGRIAAAASPARLLLTHFYPGWDPSDALPIVADHYAGPVTLASDGLRLDL